MEHVRVDHVVRAEEIAPLLVRLAKTPADMPEGARPVPENIRIEVNIAKEDKATDAGVLTLGAPSKFARAEETQRRADLVRMAVMNEEPKAMAAGR